MEVKAQENIRKGNIIFGEVSAGQARSYYLSENLTRGTFIILSVDRISGEGKFTLSKDMKVIAEYMVFSRIVSSSPFDFQFCPFILPENGTGYVLNVTSLGSDFEFSFFYDVADILKTKNYKTILFESGAVGYYIDLERGDRLLLELTAPENTEFDILAVPSLEAGFSGSILSPTFSSFFTPSPKSVDFVTDYQARFLILVVSTTGTGNFTLLTSHTGNPVEGGLEFLRAKIDTLNNLIDNLILICVVSLFMSASNLYLYLRLRRKIQQSLSAQSYQEKQSAS